MDLFSVGALVEDRYEITGRLGQGGMAQVFRAHDRHLDRNVALKVLRPHLTEADQERFRREIKALARLSHPGIVSIYDLGRGEHVYFAMELIEGGLFTDLGPLESDLEPMSRFLEAAITVAETLAYVHRHGMVHRDLTPRNILLTPYGQPKVMDFGLVQLAEVSRQLTRTGLTLGTPQYMAPEQATGEPIGAHTDLYALGAVLYRAVTGVAPFEAENDQAVLYQHVYGDPPSPLEFNPDLPQDLAALILHLLAKDPHKRPGSGQRVAEALRALRGQLERASTHQRAGGPGQCGYLAHGPVNPGDLQRIWTQQLAAGPQWPAALTAAEGFILLGSTSEELLVLHPADGQTLKRFAADDEVNGVVNYRDGRIFFASRDGSLQALSWPAGERLWHDPNAAAVGLLPFAGDLLVTTATGTLERRTADGRTRWRYQVDKPAATAPTLHGRTVSFMSRDGWLHCVGTGGEACFKVELGPGTVQPTAAGDLLLLAERGGDLHAFDTNRRETIWSYDTEGQLWAAPVVWDRFVYVISWAGVMRCLSLQTGDDVWAAPLDSRVTATPVLAAGVLYAATEDGDIVALDARSGAELFRDRVAPLAIQASPLVLQGTLVVAALDGTVQAYR